MESQIKKLGGNTIELAISLPWLEVKSQYDQIVEELFKDVEVAGFRKGKAPRDLALKHIDKTKVLEQVLQLLIPHLYAEVVKKYELKPIISPKVEVLEASENKDWRIKITTCEKPVVSLGDYREAIQKLQHNKKAKIWVPGKKQDKKDEEVTLGEILDTLATVIHVDLSDILLDQEVNRMLSNLISETQKLGMTIEQYLHAQSKTSDSLRSEYRKQAHKTLSLEFALEEISEKEHITIEPQEIEAVIKNAKTDEEKKTLEKQRYYIGSILRRQKTLSYLLKPKLTL